MNETSASALLYEQILTGARHPKTKAAIENIKLACDYLAKKGITITISEVGEICKKTGPAEQSIRNNRNFRSYVLTRASEQDRTAVRKKAELPPLRTGNPQWDAEIEALEATLRHTRKEYRRLKRAIENAGEYDIQKSLEGGRLVLAKSSVGDDGMIYDDALQTIERVLDLAWLEQFGFEVIRGRVIAPDRNEAVFITKIDWERIQQAIALNRASHRGLPPPR